MRFRFTIRDLLWLTAVAAFAVGWWLNRAENQRLVDHLKSLQRELKAAQSTAYVQIMGDRTLPLKDAHPTTIHDESVEKAMQTDRLQTPHHDFLFRPRSSAPPSTF
jgi:hypothetical protein